MFLGWWGRRAVSGDVPSPDWHDLAEGEFALSYRVGHFASSFHVSSPALLLFGQLRLDNPDELRRAAGLGDDRTPNETLLAAVEHLGLEAFNLIEGQFAVAVWDKVARSLTLVRDALGGRPLYVARRAEGLFFGSHAGEVADRAGAARIDFEEVASFLMQRRPVGPRSFFAGVQRVAPGSLVRYGTPFDAHVERWWQPDLSPTRLEDPALIEELEREFNRSVGSILSRHPAVTAHLSAGMDSSLSVATASRQIGVAKRLPAFCASPGKTVSDSADEAIGDEYPIAAQTAAMLGNVDLNRTVAEDESWISVSDRFSAAAGMPYRNAMNLGWLAASYAAAAGLGATGLIESSQGNTTLSWIGKGAIPTLLRQGRFGELLTFIRDVRRTGSGSGLLVIPWGLWGLMPRWLADTVSALQGTPTAARQAFLRPDHPAVRTAVTESRKSGQWNRKFRPTRVAADRLDYMLWAESGSHAAAVEAMYGLELADPYASRRLVEMTLRIEEPRFLDRGSGRRFARAMLRGKVPAVVSDGVVDWQQATDWRVRALETMAVIQSELRFAEDHPDLSALLDLPRIRAEVGRWSDESDSIDAMSRSAGVMRAVTAIRFVRKVAAADFAWPGS